MPAQLNIQEIFTTDSQAELASKLNFNFAKFIEIGIGDQGPQGDPGPQGSVGPSGPAGPRGPKGSTIYTGTSTLTVPTALQYDLFITNGGQFWHKGTSAWTKVFSIKELLAQTDNLFFNEKLFTELPSGLEASTVNINKSFITLLRNGGDDLAQTQSNSVEYGPSKNDYRNATLFLNNFDLDVFRSTWIPNPTSTNSQGQELNKLLADAGKSIATIYSNFLETTSELASRSHIQLGALYKIDDTRHIFTPADNNLKIKHQPIKPPSSTNTFFISEFDNGGDNLLVASSTAITSGFKFRSSQVSTVGGVTTKSPISMYFGGSPLLTGLAGGDSTMFDKNNGIMLERITQGSTARGMIAISDTNSFNITTSSFLNIFSSQDITILSHGGNPATDPTKRVVAKRFGAATSEKITAIGIGGAPNSALTVYGTKTADTTYNSLDSRNASDQVNLGTATKSSFPKTAPANTLVYKPREANSSNNAAYELSSYIGINSYFNDDPANANFFITDRLDPTASPTGANGSGGAFIATRDGSLHFISFAKDPLAITDIADEYP